VRSETLTVSLLFPGMWGLLVWYTVTKVSDMLLAPS
jgi:hypothetical protein